MEIYVKELPKDAHNCPCNYDTFCRLHEVNHYGKDKEYHCLSCFDDNPPEDCPLKLMAYHDKELKEKVIGALGEIDGLEITRYDAIVEKLDEIFKGEKE